MSTRGDPASVLGLQSAEEAFHFLAECVSGHAIFFLTDRGIVANWNRGATAVFGYEGPDILGRHMSVLFNDEDRANKIPEQALAVSAQAGTFEVEGWSVRRDGSAFWSSRMIRARRDEDGGLSGFASVTRDLTARRLAEQALRRAQEAVGHPPPQRASELENSAAELRLRTYIDRVLTLREEERARISRDIHDIFGQRLTAIKLDVTWLRHLNRQSRSSAHDVSTRLEAIVDSVDEMIRATRELATQLRPGILDKFGLIATIEWELREFSSRTGIRSTFDAPADEPALGDAQSTAAYRILQEALTNVVRHAEARNVRVRVRTDAGTFAMSVEDDGKGIAEASIDDVRSLGILGMYERARLAGGQLSIGRNHGGGTAVSLVYLSLPGGSR